MGLIVHFVIEVEETFSVVYQTIVIMLGLVSLSGLRIMGTNTHTHTDTADTLSVLEVGLADPSL